MPLALSFVLIGFFLWAAENGATFLRAWQYPSQESVWTVVHAAKLGSWSLLVVVSIVLVAAVKAYEGKLYGSAGDLTVLRAYDPPPELRGPPLPGQRDDLVEPGPQVGDQPAGSVTAAESTLMPMQHWSSCESSVIIAAQPGSGPNGYIRTIRDPAM